MSDRWERAVRQEEELMRHERRRADLPRDLLERVGDRLDQTERIYRQNRWYCDPNPRSAMWRELRDLLAVFLLVVIWTVGLAVLAGWRVQ